MKIKKKELRKREAQLPINYPDPDVLPESLPGGAIDLDAELVRVEVLCKRLAHNEVAVRDAVLAEVPRYLERLTEPIREMEVAYADEIKDVESLQATHPHTKALYHYENLPLALQLFRNKAQKQERLMERRTAMQELRSRRAREQRERETQGRYGPEAPDAAEVDEEEALEAGEGPAATNVHKTRYREWMQAWCDVELIFLKLCRGLHFCLWHSDKPLVQLACAQQIADLLDSPCTARAKILFYGSLFRVLSREWPTIDRWRLDKYLALVRKMIFAWIAFLRQVGEKSTASGRKTTSLSVAPASGKEKDGLSRHATASTEKPNRRTVSGLGGNKRGRSADKTAEAGQASTSVPLQVGATVVVSPSRSMTSTTQGIPAFYCATYFGALPELHQALQEVLFILQTQIFPNTSSTGLTMHICDVAFDELTRARVSTDLFQTLTAGIPLYAMSLGNYVEKRVLDNFFPPLVGGVFASRRTADIASRLLRRLVQTGDRAAERAAKKAIQAKAQRLADRDTEVIIRGLVECCRYFSIAKGTAREVRAMFSEAQLVLQQSVDTETYEPLDGKAKRRRLEYELKEVDDIRDLVRNERAVARVERRKKASGGALAKSAGGSNLGGGTRKTTRPTKRKKNYQLTKEDLYGEATKEE